jgi:hypothetical protein
MSNSKVSTTVIREVSNSLIGETLHVITECGYTRLRAIGDNQEFWGEVDLCFENEFAKALGEALIKAARGE